MRNLEWLHNGFRLLIRFIMKMIMLASDPLFSSAVRQHLVQGVATQTKTVQGVATQTKTGLESPLFRADEFVLCFPLWALKREFVIDANTPTLDIRACGP